MITPLMDKLRDKPVQMIYNEVEISWKLEHEIWTNVRSEIIHRFQSETRYELRHPNE